MISRRTLLGSIAVGAAPGLLRGAPAEQRKLACMTMVYRGHSFTRALEGIAKAGFKYVAPSRNHQGKDVADVELDLCADFDIRVMVGGGPWYYQKWPNLPKRDLDFQKEVAAFYVSLEQLLPHAASRKVVMTLKPHTGITARARDCLAVVKRLPSDWLKICWDAGNVSFYEGIYPDPDLADLAPYVNSVCIKDHQGPRGENNFPVPGTGQIDHESMFRILYQAGFHGPMAIETLAGRDNVMRMPAELVDERAAAAFKFLSAIADRTARPAGAA